MVNFYLNCERTCFRLAQVLLRFGQTLFSTFLIWLSAGDCLLPGWITGGESYPSFRCKFVGRSVLLCFGFLYEKSSFSWLAGQWGSCSHDPPWSYADARVFKGAKIGFGLGTLKFSLHLVFWHTGSPV
jgi:hypothetical protein